MKAEIIFPALIIATISSAAEAREPAVVPAQRSQYQQCMRDVMSGRNPQLSTNRFRVVGELADRAGRAFRSGSCWCTVGLWGAARCTFRAEAGRQILQLGGDAGRGVADMLRPRN